MRQLISNILFTVILIFTSLSHGAEPAKKEAVQPPPADVVIKMTWLSNLTDKDREKFQSLGRTPVKIEHPAFTASVPKGWYVSPSGAFLDFEEAVSISEPGVGIIININLDHRKRLGLDASLKKYGKGVATDINQGGKTLKEFSAGDSKWRFYESKNYDVLINITLPAKKLESRVEAEYNEVLNNLRLK